LSGDTTPTAWDELRETKKEDNIYTPKKMFLDSITKIERVRGMTEKEQPTWRITFDLGYKKAILEIDNKKMTCGPFELNSAFYGVFGFFIPWDFIKKPDKGEKNEWLIFLKGMAQIAVDAEPDNRTEWIECDLLLEKIAGFGVLEDRAKWANKTIAKNTLLREERGDLTYYILKSGDMSALIKDLKIATPIGGIGAVMDNRGIKRKNNPTVRIPNTGKVVPRAWWFTEKSLEIWMDSRGGQMPGTEITTPAGGY